MTTIDEIRERRERERLARLAPSEGGISDEGQAALGAMSDIRERRASAPREAMLRPMPRTVLVGEPGFEAYRQDLDRWQMERSNALLARINISFPGGIDPDLLARRQRNAEMYGTTAISTDLAQGERNAGIVSRSPVFGSFFANETNAQLARDDIRPLSFWQIVGDMFRFGNASGDFSQGGIQRQFGGENRTRDNIQRHVARGVYQTFMSGQGEQENVESALDNEGSNLEGAPLSRRLSNFVFRNSRAGDDHGPLTREEQWELNAYRHDEMMGLIARADMSDNFGGWFLENIVPTAQGLMEIPAGAIRGGGIAWERAVRNWEMGGGGTPADAIERTWAVLSLAPDIAVSGAVGAVTSPMGFTYQQEAGQAYLEYTMNADENGDFMDRRIAGAFARDVGTINAAFELVNFAGVARALGVSKLGGYLASAGVRSAFRRYTINEGLRRMTMGIAGSALAEGGTEAMQETTVIALGEWARLADSGALDDLSPGELAGRLFDVVLANSGRILEAGVAGAVIGGGIGTIVAPITIGSLIEDARVGEYQQAIWQSIETQSENSKLRQRSPSVYERLISKLVQGTPLEQIAINVEDFIGAFNQDVDLARAAARELNGVGVEAFDAAQQSGGDIFIPAGTMSSQIAGTAQYQHIAKYSRLGAEIPSMAEVEARLELGVDVEAAIEAGMQLNEQIKTLGEAKARVRQEIIDRLSASGSYGDANFDAAMGTIFADAVFTIAAAAGMDPTQLPPIPAIIGPFGATKVLPENAEQGGFATMPVDLSDMSKGVRGATQFEWTVDGFIKAAKVIFTESRNESTAPHEIFGHYFLEVMRFVAAQPNATPVIKQDWQAILDHVGMTNERWEAAVRLSPQDAAAALAPAHEKFARTVEVYFLEGRAPSLALKRVMRMLKIWMVRAFKITQRMNERGEIVNSLYQGLLDDRIRPVLDRMFASQEAIAEYAELIGSDEILTREEWGGVGNRFADASYERYKTRIVEARRTAEEAIDAAAIALVVKENMRERRRAEARAKRTVAAEMEQDPAWQAQALITGRLELPNAPGIRLNSALVFEEYGKDTHGNMPSGSFDVDADGLFYEAMQARGVKEPLRFGKRVQQLGIHDPSRQIEALQGNKKGLRNAEQGISVGAAITTLWDEGWFGERNRSTDFFQRHERDPKQPVYLRIGDWHSSERSRNYARGETEAGVSVYDIGQDGNPVVGDGEWTAQDLADRLSSEAPKYLVQGEYVGVGGDGEPLLRNVRIVGRWPAAAKSYDQPAVARSARGIPVMTRGGEQVSITPNPSNSTLMRMTFPPAWDRENKWKYDTLRYIVDADGTMYVAPAEVLHDDMVRALTEKGVNFDGYVFGAFDNESGYDKGYIRREGDQLIKAPTVSETYEQGAVTFNQDVENIHPTALRFGTEAEVRDLLAIVNSGAGINEILAHPLFVKIQEHISSLEQTLSSSEFDNPDALNDFDYVVNGNPATFAEMLDDAVKVARAYSPGGVVSERIATMVVGNFAAGKSTFIKQIARHTKAAVVDADQVKSYIPSYEDGFNTGATNNESAFIRWKVRDVLMASGDNIVIEHVGQNPAAVIKSKEDLERDGYTVTVVHVRVEANEATRRSTRRFIEGGRYINPKDTRAVVEAGLVAKAFDEMVENKAIQAYIEIDATPPPRQATLLRSQGGELQIQAVSAALRSDAQVGGTFQTAVSVRPEQRDSLDRATGDSPNRVSTRHPWAADSQENAFEERLIIGLDSVLSDEKFAGKVAEHLRGLVNMPVVAGETDIQTIERYIDHVVDNLLWLHDSYDASTRDRADEWYVGARAIVDVWTQRYGINDYVAAGVLAALSPQKDWFQNVSLAERTLDTYLLRRDFAWTPEMTATADLIYPHIVRDKKGNPVLKKNGEPKSYTHIRDSLDGRSIIDIERGMNNATQDKINTVIAAWVRVYDQTYNDRAYRLIMPEGGFGDFEKNNDGSNTKTAWGSLNEIGKAISMIRNPDYRNIVNSLGEQHKVRNFYNNILAPFALFGDVTIDTHAVAAALLRPLSGTSKEVDVNLNGPPSHAASGSIGTYGINAEAYRRAALARGILPRQMQSITWEAIRTLFRDTWKTKANNDLINEIWQEYRDGKITIQEAREKISTAAGGIKPPAWVGTRSFDGLHASDGYSTYEGELPRSRLSRWVAGTVDSGAGRPASDRVARRSKLGPTFFQLEEEFEARSQEMADRIVGDVALSQDETFAIYAGLLADHNEKMGRAMRLSLAVEATPVGKREALAAEAMVEATATYATITDVFSKMISRYGQDAVSGLGVPISFEMRDSLVTTDKLNSTVRERKGELAMLRRALKGRMTNAFGMTTEQIERVIAAVNDEIDIMSAEIERRTKTRPASAFQPSEGMRRLAAATDEEVMDWFYNSGEVRVVKQRDTGDPAYYFKLDKDQKTFPARLMFDFDYDGNVTCSTIYRGRFSNRDWDGSKKKPTAAQLAASRAFFARMVLLTRAYIIINKPPSIKFTGGSESHEKLYGYMMSLINSGGYTARREKDTFGWFHTGPAAAGRPHSSVSVNITFRLLRPDIAAQTPPTDIAPTAVSESNYSARSNIKGRKPGTLIWFSEETTDVKNPTGAEPTRDPAASRYFSGGGAGNVRAIPLGIGRDDAVTTASLEAKQRALRTLDEAEGWFYQEEEAPTEGEFLDALRDDLSGVSPRYRAQDIDAAFDWAEAQKVREFFARRGIDISAKPKELRAQIELIAEQLDSRGIDADTMASALNAHLGYRAFDTGGDMLAAVVALPKRSEYIKQRVDEIVRGELGDPMDDMPSAAKLAMHNINEEERILMELQATQEAAGSGAGRAINRTARDYARRRIERMRVRELQNPDWALKTERRWAKAAVEAARKGDMAAANKAKFNQLVNFHIYKEARAVQIEMERTQLYFRKIQKLSARTRITPDYYEQIEALLDQYEVRNISTKEVQRRIGLAEWIKEMEDKGLGHMVQIDPALIARSGKTPFQQLTIEEARALRDAVKNLDHLGSLKDRLLTAADQRSFENVLGTLIGAMEQTGPVDPKLTRNYSESDIQKAQGKLRRWNAALTRMEFLFRYIDGKHNGPVWNALFRPFTVAADKKSAYQHRVAMQLSNLWDQYSESERASMFKTRVSVPELLVDSDVTGENDVFTRMQLLAIALNVGNEGNVRALVDGFGWFRAPEGLETDYVTARQKIIAVLDKHLNERDWRFVQETWSIIGQFRDEAFDLHQRLTGLRPEAVEASPVASKHGTFAGGYYPLKFDPLRDATTERREAKENTPVNNWGVSSLAPMTKKGHLIDRKGSGGRPVRLDFAVATEHIENVIHDISYREALIDANRIVSDSRFRAAFIRTVGKEQYAQLHPWLHSIAVEYRDPTSDVGKLLQKMRGNMQIVTMGIKIATATQQLTGLLQAVPMLGSVEMAGGVVRMLNNPFQLREKSEYIMGKSEFMRTRVRTYNRDVREFLRRVEDDSLYHKTQRNAFALVGAMDWAVSSVVWIAAYEKARAGNVDGIDGGVEEDAVRFADSIVRQTQSAGLNQDLPLVMRNTEVEKMVTAFYSYFSVLYNWTAYDQVLGVRKKRVPLYMAAGNFFLIYILAPLITEWLAGRWDKEGEDDEERLQRMLRVIARMPFSSVPILRDIANTYGSFYDYSLTPFESGLQSAIDTVEDIASGEILTNEGAQKNAAFAVGFVFGLPTAQMYITADYIRDYAEGEEEGLDLTEALLRDTR